MGGFGNVLDKPVYLLEVLQTELVEGAEAAVLGGERVVFHPAAAGELVEIVLRNGSRVEVLGTDAGGLLLGARCSHKGNRCKRKNEFFHTIHY